MGKVLITLPDDLLDRIDREVRQHRSSRSLLQEAAARQLGWSPPSVIDAAVARGKAALSGAGRFDAADLITEDRRSRDAADRRR